MNYRKQWINIKNKVLCRDKYKCTRSGENQKRLAVHHLDQSGDQQYNRDSNNRMKNLITLCLSCHTKTHWEIGTNRRYIHILPDGEYEDTPLRIL